MTTTAIEWTDKTWNPVRGCSVVSEGCRNCYAMKQAHRFSGHGKPYHGLTEIGPHGPRWTGTIRPVPELLDEPLKWAKPCRVFVNSMSDLFHEDITNEFIAAVFGIMAARPDHTFQVLTKRPQRMNAWFSWLQDRGGLGPYIRSIRVDGDRTLPRLFDRVAKMQTVRGKRIRSMEDPWMIVFNAAACCGKGPLPNVWLGVSVEDQKTADERIPTLLNTPAAVRWISAEPLLGPVDLDWVFDPSGYACCGGDESCYGNGRCPLSRWPREDDGFSFVSLDWVVVGGESGPGARPCNLAWIRSIVQQCKGAGTPVFVKQLGSCIADRNDAGFEGDTETCWPSGTRFEQEHSEEQYQGTLGRVRLHDRKGGDPAEWPEDLRVRDWPA